VRRGTLERRERRHLESLLGIIASSAGQLEKRVWSFQGALIGGLDTTLRCCGDRDGLYENPTTVEALWGLAQSAWALSRANEKVVRSLHERRVSRVAPDHYIPAIQE